MTNENLAVISAIKSFKRENDIFKQVINNLVNEDADENLIILLLNPDLVDKIIEPDKYTEALDYLMNTYQTERSSIVREKMLKRYEKRVQGEILEASVSSIPTKEAIESSYIKDDDIKKAENAAKTFEDNPVKVPISPKNHDILNANNANKKVKKGADEIALSLDPGFKEAKKASEDFAKKHEVKAKVEVPHVSVTPKKEVKLPKVEPKKENKEEIKKEEPKKEEKKKNERPVLSTPSPAARTTGELDNKMHEVKKTRSVSKFFKEHKKGMLIATGLAMVAVTSAIFSPIIIPSLISANATCEALAGTAAVKSLFHGLNTALAKTIGATFMNSQWLNSAGAAITSTVAKGGLLTALGTYGLWGAYGTGFVVAIKNMFKAVNLPSKKSKENYVSEKIEYHPTIEDNEHLSEKDIKDAVVYEKNVGENYYSEPIYEELYDKKVYDIPTQEDLRVKGFALDNEEKEDSVSEEPIYEEVKQEENLSYLEEAPSEEYFGPTQEDLRMKGFALDNEEKEDSVSEELMYEEVKREEEKSSDVEEAPSEEYYGPTQEDLRMKGFALDNEEKEDSIIEEPIYEEVKQEENLSYLEEAPSEEYFGPIQEDLRMNASNYGLEDEGKKEDEEFIDDLSLIDELRKNAPKKIIEIKDDGTSVMEEEQSFQIPSEEELKADAINREKLNKLLEPDINYEKPKTEETEKIEALDDRLSQEKFERLIRELQESNAAKKAREDLFMPSTDYGMGMGL